MPKWKKIYDASGLQQEIEQLRGAGLDEVRSRWRKTFKSDGNTVSRDLMIRMLVWQMQEQAFGGFDRATLKALDRYAGPESGASRASEERTFGVGAVLVREYRGVRHTVTVAREGFVWREKAYANLSRIAREITGAQWNGPRFFGLRQGKNAVTLTGAEAA